MIYALYPLYVAATKDLNFFKDTTDFISLKYSNLFPIVKINMKQKIDNKALFCYDRHF